jgi:hypothetical protein
LGLVTEKLPFRNKAGARKVEHEPRFKEEAMNPGKRDFIASAEFLASGFPA